MIFIKQSYDIAKKLVRYSRFLKWIDFAGLLFWIAESALYEHLPTDVSEKYRLASLHLAGRTWLVIYLALILITFWEGIIRWYGAEIAPIIGPAGSLQYQVCLVAAQLGALVRDCSIKYGDYPLGSLESDPNLLKRQWAWEEQLSKQFRADLKDRIQVVLDRLAAEGVENNDATQIVREHTLHPVKALDTARIIFGMALTLSIKDV